MTDLLLTMFINMLNQTDSSFFSFSSLSFFFAVKAQLLHLCSRTYWWEWLIITSAYSEETAERLKSEKSAVRQDWRKDDNIADVDIMTLWSCLSWDFSYVLRDEGLSLMSDYMSVVKERSDIKIETFSVKLRYIKTNSEAFSDRTNSVQTHYMKRHVSSCQDCKDIKHQHWVMCRYISTTESTN